MTCNGMTYDSRHKPRHERRRRTYPLYVDHNAFGSLGIGMSMDMEYEACVFEDGQVGFAGGKAAVKEH